MNNNVFTAFLLIMELMFYNIIQKINAFTDGGPNQKLLFLVNQGHYYS